MESKKNMFGNYTFQNYFLFLIFISNCDRQNMSKIVDHFGHFGTMGGAFALLAPLPHPMGLDIHTLFHWDLCISFYLFKASKNSCTFLYL